MRIAIFHDYIGTIGGGEKLVLTLARGLGADVITTDVEKDSVRKMGFEDVNIISLGSTVRVPPLKQISASFRFASCDYSKDYDFFIFSGNWSHLSAKRHKPNLYYCYTPVRQFYDLRDYFRKTLPTFIHMLLFELWATVHSYYDLKSIKYVDRIVAISLNTGERIRRYYNRDFEIVYPPVDTSKYHFKEYGDFWLSVNRLYPEKRVELQIEAFKNLPAERLKIVGSVAEGDHSRKYARNILKNLPPNVEVLGLIPEEELINLYSRCKGFITTSMSEDFGMTPVEAMASGKAVVGIKEGGCLETVIDGSTGLLVSPDVSSIADAVSIISKEPFKYKEKCMEHARKFDVSIFLKRMKRELELYC